MKQKTDWLNVVKYAGAYIAFIIGSGFAKIGRAHV